MPTSQTNKAQRPRAVETLAVIHPNAAGLDIGSREIWASVPADRDAEPVRRFGTFTLDLERLVAWLIECQIDLVALESTGVYWIPVFEMLEAHSIHAALVEPRQLKRVPGRKSDYLDCQWIQRLHSLGMLTASFRPDAEMRTLRIYLRHRAELLERRAPHILHRQKALQQMNLQLHPVLSDVTGVTGLKILRAIVAGERDRLRLAQLRNPACKSSTDRIAQALTGTWLPEHLFVLRQSLEFYDFYTAQVADCDAMIERQFAALKPRWESEVPEDLPPRATGASENRGAVLLSAASPPPLKPDSHSKNQPSLRTRAELLRVTGVDLVAVHGISASPG
ncbi:MAG: IS110 family transposase [Anaerolineales bacterium]